MNGWLELDRIAARRGDGLRPALRALLRERARMSDPSGRIVDIAALRETGPVQAGPAPSRELPVNITPLADFAARPQNRASSGHK